jgi:serine phosphatase RsbU (regulator of sigma subunit)
LTIPYISTSAHQHISTSAHQHISTSAHQHISTSAHLHFLEVCTFVAQYYSMSRFRIFLLSIFFSVSLFSQDQRAIDSLQLLLKTAKDTNRVILLNKIADEYHHDNPKAALPYATQALVLSQQLQYVNGLYQSNLSKGMAFYFLSQFDSALHYQELARNYAEQSKNFSHLATVYTDLGNVYGDMGQNKKCLQYYLIASDYTDKLNKPLQHSFILVNIGTIYSGAEQHDSALVYYLRAEKVISGIDKNHEVLPIVLNNIGSSYLELHDTVQAEKAYREGLRIAVLHNEQRDIASAYDHLAVVIYSQGKRDSAMMLFRKAIEIYDTTDSKNGTAEVCSHIGEFYKGERRYDSALFYLTKGMKVAEETNDYYNLKNYYNSLSDVYDSLGKSALALEYLRKLIDVKDTIAFRNSSSLVNEVKTEAAFEKTEEAFKKNQTDLDLANERDQKKTIFIYAAIAVVILLLLLGIVAFNRYLVKKRSSELLEKQNDEINIQKNIIEEKNKDITDSIKYAQRIQNAILPSKEQIKTIFQESFVLFRPKDIVSGDFYWFEKSGEYKLFSVVDCTGHGVPGAMLSVVGHNMLNKAVHDNKLVMPDKLLQYLNENISNMLRQKHEDQVIQDGMDIALCSYHQPTQTLYYAGSFNSLYLIRNNELQEIKSDKIFIGNYYQEPDKKFTLHTIKVEKNDLFYVFSDGFADQFGGPTGKKFKYKPFQQLLLSMQNETMEGQEKKLANSFEEWKRNLDQVDDVCIIGVKIG